MTKLWQRLNHFEAEPGLQRAAQKPAGKALLFGLFGLLLWLIYPEAGQQGRNLWWQVYLAAIACGLAGPYRRQMLALTTLLLFCAAPGWFPTHWLDRLAVQQQVSWPMPELLRYATVALVFALSSLLIWARRKGARSLPGRWPLFCLLAAFSLLLAAVTASAATGWLKLLLFTLVWGFGAYFWYIVYAVRDAVSRKSSPIWFQLASFHPYFAGTWIPIGLGAANLRQTESANAQELAITQLKGFKLLCHCWLMARCYDGLLQIRQFLHVPPFEQLLRQHLSGAGLVPRGLCWLSMLDSFFDGMLSAYVLGNLLVACARLGGFRLLQQVYKPLAARSLIDYWNRISYYYKQLMVELFFFPSFLGFYKSSPRLRQAFAVFMAVVAGNLIYHFRPLLGHVAQIGLFATLQGMQTYVCYCAILWVGLTLSLWGSTDLQQKKLHVLGRLGVLFRIILFYSLLSVFDEPYTTHSPVERLGFLAYLCGL